MISLIADCDEIGDLTWREFVGQGVAGVKRLAHDGVKGECSAALQACAWGQSRWKEADKKVGFKFVNHLVLVGDYQI